VTLAALLSETSQALAQAGSLRGSLESASKQATGATHDSIQQFQEKLSALLAAPPGPNSTQNPPATLTRANGDVGTLYTQISQVDAEPTAAQSEAIVGAELSAKDAMQRWETLKSTDLPALNHLLHEANLPVVNVEADPHKEDSGMDEE